MHRKLDIQDFDIPKDDVECWEKYPKHHWVYDLSRLFDAQSIPWSPYRTELLTNRELVIKLESNKILLQQSGYIYTKRGEEQLIVSELYIVKGEIKLIRYIDLNSGIELPQHGELELRLNAFITLHFQKFTGVITATMCGNEIHRMRLCPYTIIDKNTNQEVIRLLKRIYKKNDMLNDKILETM